jgi:hypothetical protein
MTWEGEVGKERPLHGNHEFEKGASLLMMTKAMEKGIDFHVPVRRQNPNLSKNITKLFKIFVEYQVQTLKEEK